VCILLVQFSVFWYSRVVLLPLLLQSIDLYIIICIYKYNIIIYYTCIHAWYTRGECYRTVGAHKIFYDNMLINGTAVQMLRRERRLMGYTQYYDFDVPGPKTAGRSERARTVFVWQAFWLITFCILSPALYYNYNYYNYYDFITTSHVCARPINIIIIIPYNIVGN